MESSHAGEADMRENAGAKSVPLQKSYFDVLGICCPSEIPLVEKLLKAVDGVEKVTVIVASRTVIVVHDASLVSPADIVKVLNHAKMEASIQSLGKEKRKKSWPSPYTMASGCLLLISTFKFIYLPLQWFAVGAAIIGLPPIIMRSIMAIFHRTLDVNILALIAAAGSLFLEDFWEAGFLVFLFTIAVWLESRAIYKASSAMSSLMSMTPPKAVLAESGEVVDAQDVKVNTILAVKAGEAIPIDGVVIEGKSEVDEKTLTGESFPVDKQVDSPVWAGTINLSGYLNVKTTALAKDCAVARMAVLIEEAQNSKSKTQRLIDECAKYYTPVVLLVSVGVAIIPAALRVRDLRHWLHLALVLLVSACPCALVLSTPVATYCTLTRAATFGLLVKGGDYLEAMAKVKVVCFDKTGTISRGDFVIREFRSLCHEINTETLLFWVSSMESKSSHPMAASLIEYSRSNSVEPETEVVQDFKIYPGEGIYGKINGKDIYVGNRKIAARAGCVSVEEMSDGLAVGYVYMGAALVGVFSLSDTCRTGAVEAMTQLKAMGIRTSMLTGDSEAAALSIHRQMGQVIDSVHAELLPEEKVNVINEFKKNTGRCVMVGDGMNDAPALAVADVGISMGISGAAVAIETGHVTLMSNDLRKIPLAIKLARHTWWKIIQNVAVSLAAKIGIVAVALAGHPLLWAAVVADVGTCLLVICNSMRPQGLLIKRKKCCGRSHAAAGSKTRWSEETTQRREAAEHKSCSHCGDESVNGSKECGRGGSLPVDVEMGAGGGFENNPSNVEPSSFGLYCCDGRRKPHATVIGEYKMTVGGGVGSGSAGVVLSVRELINEP